MKIDTPGYEPFIADGRKKATSNWALPGTGPLSVTHSHARALINRFKETGRSNHSAQGGTLWVVLTWCHFHAVPYKLTAVPGLGYMVEHAPEYVT